MSLSEILADFSKYRNIVILPSVKEEVLHNIHELFKIRITPDLWKDFQRSYTEEKHTPEDFLDRTQELVKEVVEDYFRKNGLSLQDTALLQRWVEVMWDESQSLWPELSEEFNANLSFVLQLYDAAKRVISDQYPDYISAFGETASQFFTDLIFQGYLHHFTRELNPPLVDHRRMMNIAGQFVESIMSTKIFLKEMDLGDIVNEVEGLRKSDYPGRKEYFRRFPNGSTLTKEQVLRNLKMLRKYRNIASHGGSDPAEFEDILENGFDALFNEKDGVISVVYNIIRPSKKEP